nr:AMP-binding protein [Orenia metallireducens]
MDNKKTEVTRGEVGEIAVQGDNVMKGYFKKPEATTKALRNGWLHTWDLGKMNIVILLRVALLL